MQPSDGSPGAGVFPYVATTYRLTEHHTAGGMSRWLPYLSELQPEFFCEVSPELAGERGLEHLGWATVVTGRNAIEARVLVTERMPPLVVQGRRTHQVGLPYHWGTSGYSTGDAANDLVALSLDPNVHIQDDKSFACDIRPGRRPRGAAKADLVREYQRRGWHAPRTPGWRYESGTDVNHARASRGCQIRCGQACGRRSIATLTRRRRAGTPTHRHGSDSSPIPRYASDARRARSLARSGTRFRDDGLMLTGISLDNTIGLGANLAACGVHRAAHAGRSRAGTATSGGRRRRGRRRLSLVDVVRCVQALHARGLP